MRMPQPRTCLSSLAAAAAALVAVSLCGASCTKKDDGPRPTPIGPSTTAPVAAAPAPAAPAENLPAPAPNPPMADPAAAGKPGGTIIGKITLASARKADVSPNDAVYLVARRIADNPHARGSLVAVKRFTAASFPIEFSLGAADMMFQNGAFEGELALSARVDKDGDPMTRKKGDVFGTLDRVKVGATGVDLKLDQLQKEDESLGGAPPMMGGSMPAGHP
jgi:hypothetical protein